MEVDINYGRVKVSVLAYPTNVTIFGRVGRERVRALGDLINSHLRPLAEQAVLDAIDEWEKASP